MEYIKLYVYKNGEYFDGIDYDDFDEALDVALENGCDEIEMHIWKNRDSYNNYEPAEKQLLAWSVDRGTISYDENYNEIEF